MWTTVAPGGSSPTAAPPGFDASWEGPGGWTVAAAGGRQPIRIGNRDIEVQLQPVESENLPAADEQYVCGDAWHVTAPQGTGPDEDQFGHALVFRMIQADDQMAVLEVIVSIQTRLLDAHPTIDLVVSPGEVLDGAGPPGRGTAPVRRVQTGGGDVVVLLGPHDAPFTTDRSGPAGLRLRLFGEFLEKGVIRKCRPWIALAPAGQLGDTDVESLYQKMLSRPLPLTP